MSTQQVSSAVSELFHPQTLMGRGRLAILVSLALLTVGAWALTIYQVRTMDMPMGIAVRGGATDHIHDGMSSMAMSGTTSGGWSLNELLTFTGVWTVMMAAMMFPAAAPVLLLVGAVHDQRRARGGAFVPTWIFAAGYLLIWAAIGIATYALVQLGSDLATRIDAGSRAKWAPLALGATLGLAGIYQITPLKRACLGHCRSPFGFVMAHWREGRLGALRLGIVHGAYCLGCCWALFAIVVATGMMSLAWMILLTLVVFVEKVIPHGQRAAIGVGIALMILGVFVASGASAAPGNAL